MKILTAAEVEELLEHFTARPDIWLEHGGAWVRRVGRMREKCSVCLGKGKVEDGLLIHSENDACTWCRGTRFEPSTEPEQFALALKIKNGLPDELFALSFAPISWNMEGAQNYVEWLLEKYTAYDVRKVVVEKLKRQVRNTVNIDALARDLIEVMELQRRKP